MLYQAVMDNDTEAVRSHLLSREVDVDVKAGPKEETPLHLAVQNGYKEIAELLLKHPANPNVKNKLGKTPLQYAVGTRYHEMEKILLEAKADVETSDNTGRTLMHEAAWSGNDLMVKYLLDRGLNVNVSDKLGTTPLHLAADQNIGNSHLTTIQMLLDGGADPLALDKKFNKPVDYLVKEPKLEVSLLFFHSMRMAAGKLKRPLIITKKKVVSEEKSAESKKKRDEDEVKWIHVMEDELAQILALINDEVLEIEENSLGKIEDDVETTESQGDKVKEIVEKFELSKLDLAAEEVAEIETDNQEENSLVETAEELAGIQNEITGSFEQKVQKETFEKIKNYSESNIINAVAEKHKVKSGNSLGNSLIFTIVTHFSVFFTSVLLYFLFQYFLIDFYEH